MVIYSGNRCWSPTTGCSTCSMSSKKWQWNSLFLAIPGLKRPITALSTPYHSHTKTIQGLGPAKGMLVRSDGLCGKRIVLFRAQVATGANRTLEVKDLEEKIGKNVSERSSGSQVTELYREIFWEGFFFPHKRKQCRGEVWKWLLLRELWALPAHHWSLQRWCDLCRSGAPAPAAESHLHKTQVLDYYIALFGDFLGISYLGCLGKFPAKWLNLGTNEELPAHSGTALAGLLCPCLLGFGKAIPAVDCRPSDQHKDSPQCLTLAWTWYHVQTTGPRNMSWLVGRYSQDVGCRLENAFRQTNHVMTTTDFLNSKFWDMGSEFQTVPSCCVARTFVEADFLPSADAARSDLCHHIHAMHAVCWLHLLLEQVMMAVNRC